jgi:hypothetical protein
LALTVSFEDIAADHFSAYKARHANSAPKIRLTTMASHKAPDSRLSPRAMLSSGRPPHINEIKCSRSVTEFAAMYKAVRNAYFIGVCGR